MKHKYHLKGYNRRKIKKQAMKPIPLELMKNETRRDTTDGKSRVGEGNVPDI